MECLLPGRHVAGTTDEHGQVPLEPVEDGLRAEQPDAGRRELDRQWQPIEPAADLGDGPGVLGGELEPRLDCASALDEEGDGFVPGE